MPVLINTAIAGMLNSSVQHEEQKKLTFSPNFSSFWTNFHFFLFFFRASRAPHESLGKEKVDNKTLDSQFMCRSRGNSSVFITFLFQVVIAKCIVDICTPPPHFTPRLRDIFDLTLLPYLVCHSVQKLHTQSITIRVEKNREVEKIQRLIK